MWAMWQYWLLPVKTEEKNLLSTSPFFVSVDASSPFSFVRRDTLSSNFLFWWSYLWYPLLFFIFLTKFTSICSLLSWFHLCMLGWHPCFLPRPYNPASTVYTFPSFPLVQLTGACWVWFLILGNGKLLYSQKYVFKRLTSLFCSYVPKFSFPEDLIQ